MWRRLSHHLLRTIAWLMLAIVVLTLPLLIALGNEAGSRWLVEKGLGMQHMLTLEVVDGNLLHGMTVRHVHLHGQHFDITISRLLLRWSLDQLLAAQVRIDELQADQVLLVLRPSGHVSTGEVKLPRLILPIRLQVVHARIQAMGMERHGKYLGFDTVTLSNGHWAGSRVTIGELTVTHHAIGVATVHGAIELVDHYNIDASGELTLNEFARQGLGPLHVQGSRNLADLGLIVDSGGQLKAHAEGAVDTLAPHVPYRVTARWQAFKSPWWAAQGLTTAGGSLQAQGDLSGLKTTGDTNFSALHAPAGQYRWRGRTDWKGAEVEDLDFKGLGGQLSAKGRVGWHGSIVWQLEAKLKQINLAQKWPALKMPVPVLTGTLSSKGQTSLRGSQMVASINLASGERWQAKLKSASRPWLLNDRQALDLTWENVGRDVRGLGRTFSRAGSLNFNGSLKGYHLTGLAGLVSPKTPQGVWRLDATGQGHHIDVNKLDYDGDVGSATFAGLLELQPHPRWEGALVVNNLQSGWLLPDWSGQFSGDVSTQGEWGPAAHNIDLSNVHLRGTLRDKPFAMDGGVQIGLPLQKGGLPEVAAKDLQTVWGDDHARIDGGLTNHWDMRVDATLHDLGLIDHRLAGQIDVQANLTGEPLRPTVAFQMAGQQLAGFGAQLQTLKVEGQIDKLGYAPGEVTADATGLTIGAHTIDAINLTLAGDRELHDLTWMVKAPEGQTEGRIHGRLNLATRDWDGSLQTGSVSVEDMQWTLDAPVAASWRMDQRTLRVQKHCWSSGEAHLCNEDELVAGPAGHARVRLNGLDAERLRKHWPEGFAWEGQVSGNADANWTEGELPEVSINLLTQGGAFRLERDEGDPLKLTYNLIAAQAFVRPDNWRLRFDLISQDMGTGYADVSIDPKSPDHALKGETAIDGVRVDVAQPFFPSLSTLSGQVAINGQIGGVLKQPQLWGQARLSKGQVVARDAPINLHDVTLQADIKGQNAQLSGQFGSGQGVANLTGDAAWDDSWQVHLNLTGKDFEVRQDPMVVARIDPDLSASVVPGQIDISGKVLVPYAKINIKELPDKAIPLSPDVQVINADRAGRAQMSAAMRSWLINANIEVLLGDDVKFNGFGVSGGLGGGIQLTQKDKRGLQAIGQVELEKDAKYDACGQKLDITRGRLLFAGPIAQPGVDLEASRMTTDGKTVGLRATGRATGPEVSFFSDSNLSQEDILSYLILGRPMYQTNQVNVISANTPSAATLAGTPGTPNGPSANPGSGNLALAMAAVNIGTCKGGSGGGLADRLGGGIVNRIGDTFGIHDVAVGSEATSTDTQVTVSGYINPKLYLSYGVGVFTPVNTVKVRYNLTPKLYLQAVSSLENAIDLYYSFKF